MNFGWRTITAEQFRDHDDPQDRGWDEAYVTVPETGQRLEVWDVGVFADDRGRIAIYTREAEPTWVSPGWPIEVR